jgi:hypothetical protein
MSQNNLLPREFIVSSQRPDNLPTLTCFVLLSTRTTAVSASPARIAGGAIDWIESGRSIPNHRLRELIRPAKTLNRSFYCRYVESASHCSSLQGT